MPQIGDNRGHSDISAPLLPVHRISAAVDENVLPKRCADQDTVPLAHIKESDFQRPGKLMRHTDREHSHKAPVHPPPHCRRADADILPAPDPADPGKGQVPGKSPVRGHGRRGNITVRPCQQAAEPVGKAGNHIQDRTKICRQRTKHTQEHSSYHQGRRQRHHQQSGCRSQQSDVGKIMQNQRYQAQLRHNGNGDS